VVLDNGYLVITEGSSMDYGEEPNHRTVYLPRPEVRPIPIANSLMAKVEAIVITQKSLVR